MSVDIVRLLVYILLLERPARATTTRPNIVLIVADDLGFNDVPWHNARVQAPTLQRLARDGVVLEQSYVQPRCTPSRAALLTGRYPFHLGRQGQVIWPLTPTGLTLNHTLLPERLRRVGYRTHMVGKWHLGYCRPEYTPMLRGFESFLGLWIGSGDYYQHTKLGGYDFHRNMSLAPQFRGKYATNVFAKEAARIISKHYQSQKVLEEKGSDAAPLFLYLSFQQVHTPLQVPKKYRDMHREVRHKKRRKLLAMVSALDAAVSRVVDALQQTGMYSNTVIVFTTDNGGDVRAGASNQPLRGSKRTLWEGGTRGVAFVHSPLLQRRGYVNRQLIHVTDWYPTLLGLAAAPAVTGADLTLDGFDQWSSISQNETSPRQEMVYNIDVDEERPRRKTAIRVGKWKLVWGSPAGRYRMNGWYPDPAAQNQMVNPSPRQARVPNINSTWLFDLDMDPNEEHDLSASHPGMVADLKGRILSHLRTLVPPDDPQQDPVGHPRNFGGAFSTGWC